ncbi:MAG: hypothetical protein L0Z50_03055 [Verrucomicrobiales bacterium]|nr:hypothetical protein [Verrucomicrobiales bacterium]
MHTIDRPKLESKAANSSSGLEQWQFTPIAVNGFGDPLNSYPHTMAWFKDHLYVGTTRANLYMLKNNNPPPHVCWPVKCPADVAELDWRAQIWRYNPRTKIWQKVFTSPLITGSNGQKIPRDIGYRAMGVFQGEHDPSPALYVCGWASARTGKASVIMRSTNGTHFKSVQEPGADPLFTTYRILLPFNGRLYTSPTGKMSAGQSTDRRSPNISGAPLLLESSNPLSAAWRHVNTAGFGDATNLTVFELAAFNGFLYAGTLNPTSGYQIWKARAEGKPPYQWTKVIAAGAYRGPKNEAVVSMCVFGNALYVGSGIQNGGYDRTYGVGPAAAELIRIYPDDSWELIVGEARVTPQGFKRCLSGFGPGFDSIANGYFWRMAEFDGVLYLGTFNWTTLLPYLQPLRHGDRGDRIGHWLGIERVVRFDGGFDLFRSRDGVHWSPVTTTGFGNPYNFGVRTMVGTPHGLFVGAANPFAPDVAVRTPTGWAYVPNPKGGAEIWLGTKRSWNGARAESSHGQDTAEA